MKKQLYAPILILEDSMVFKLKTSKRTMEIYKYIEKREHLQPYILVKLSLALAINAGYKYDGVLGDNAGLELNRQTITNEYDVLFKALIQINEKKHISEKDYFPGYIKAYIDYGAILLEQEYKYSSDFYGHLLELDKGI